MKKIILILFATILLSGCGLLPPPSPIMWENKTVTPETSDKTITLHQEIVRPHKSGRYIYLPAGVYKHVATDNSHFYFEAPTPPVYTVKQGENTDSQQVPGGIAISKSMMKPCYIYMDLAPGAKTWIWMLGMEFMSEEGNVWWKRNYKPSLL
ncbi:MAG: membrane lipoprotein lipid attachment site-containing protein [Kiritimatiellaceae bacterium]|nr:membrane lipoprotein lipid attachment site-containing protein [Kiritimatiellaceae bacterium]